VRRPEIGNSHFLLPINVLIGREAGGHKLMEKDTATLQAEALKLRE
jgi:hypothetical protein